MKLLLVTTLLCFILVGSNDPVPPDHPDEKIVIPLDDEDEEKVEIHSNSIHNNTASSTFESKSLANHGENDPIRNNNNKNI
jgi:hypothetical protein